jgi:hypothetical protein
MRARNSPIPPNSVLNAEACFESASGLIRPVPFALGAKGEHHEEIYLFVVAAVSALAVPAMADEVGVRAGPVGPGVTVGEDHRDLDRDRDRDQATVIKEHEPRDRDTVIKKDRGDGIGSRTTIHRDNN